MVKFRCFSTFLSMCAVLLVGARDQATGNIIGCRGGDSRQAPRISLTVTTNQYWKSSNRSQDLIFHSHNLGNSNAINNERIYPDDKEKSGLQACEKSNNISEAFLGSVECWSRKQPHLDIRWIRKGDMYWTQTMQPEYHRWNPWKSSYGVSCRLTNLLASQPLQKLEVICSQDGYKTSSSNGLKMVIEWLHNEQITEVQYFSLDENRTSGRTLGKLIQFTETEEDGIHSVTITQCIPVKDYLKNQQSVESSKQREYDEKMDSELQTIILIVIMGMVTGVNITMLALRWKLNREIAENQKVTSLPPPSITTPLGRADSEFLI